MLFGLAGCHPYYSVRLDFPTPVPSSDSALVDRIVRKCDEIAGAHLLVMTGACGPEIPESIPQTCSKEPLNTTGIRWERGLLDLLLALENSRAAIIIENPGPTQSDGSIQLVESVKAQIAEVLGTPSITQGKD
jgi:hypothetical protein